MEVKNRAEAWKIASEIFTTDYKKDEKKSERAGYDIYVSTASNNDAYISDLADRLEVNLETGKTVNIWISDALQKTVGAVDRVLLKRMFTLSDELKKIGNKHNVHYLNYFDVVVKDIEKIRSVVLDLVLDGLDE